MIPMYKNKQWLLIGVYSFFILFSYIFILLISVNIHIPSPSTPIKKIVTWIFHL